MHYYAVIDTNVLVSAMLKGLSVPAQIADAYLVTGNIKHFPVKPFIVTPKEMLDILRRE